MSQIVENDDIKLLWDFKIQCDNMIEARRPDIVVLHKKEKKCLIVDVAVPGDCKINEKEKEKIDKYQDLRREVSRLAAKESACGTNCNWSPWKYKQELHRLSPPIRN